MSSPQLSSPGLPAHFAPFIGRRRELAELVGLVGTTRLLSITGAGGSGKTRLALEVARRFAARHPGQMRYVELAPLGRGDLLLQHVAAQLDAQERPDRQAVDAVLEALHPGVRLLVLDNCEHVVQECAELVDTLLRRRHGLKVLATSREALGIEGECAWLLRGLDLEAVAPGGDADRPATSDAVQLFVDRARSVSSAFELTADNAAAIEQICGRLDGLPLAIELAAARVAVLSPAQIAARLDDAFKLLTTGSRTGLPRHRTLRAAVEWSYRLIAPAEQMLLRRLSVFANVYSLEAAEAICADATLPADEILELLAALVSRSLVNMQETDGAARYSLLEVIKQYAAEQLASEADALCALHRRHAEYFTALAETALPELERTHSSHWVARLTLEYDDQRAVLQRCFESGDRELAHRLVAALWWYWGQTGQWSESRIWMTEALRGPAPAPGRAWGQLLNGAGTFAYLDGDLERARGLLEGAVTILNQCQDRLHEVMATSSLVHLLCTEQRFDEALAHGQRAAGIARTLEESWPLCHAMSNGLGHAYLCLGHYELADACFQEAFEKAEQNGGHHWGLAEVTRARAALAIERGDLEQACSLLRRAILEVQTIADPHTAFRALLVAERLMSRLGWGDFGAQLSGAIDAALEQGMPLLHYELGHRGQSAGRLVATIGELAHAHESKLGRRLSVGAALEATVAALDNAAARSPSRNTGPVGQAAYDLRVRCLGNIEVLVGGAELPLRSPGRGAKPIELLVYLLAHPDGRTREQVGLAFWPDASPAQVKNNFHVQLHKLRRILGHSDLILASGDRYRVNPSVRVWFDAGQFERGVLAALRSSKADRTALAETLALYRGDFLDGTHNTDWYLEFQDRLRSLYAEGLSMLADLELENGDLGAAIAALESLTRADDLREDACRRLMECLARHGRRDQALAHYRRLVTRLRDEFDAAPAPATEALAAELAKVAAG